MDLFPFLSFLSNLAAPNGSSKESKTENHGTMGTDGDDEADDEDEDDLHHDGDDDEEEEEDDEEEEIDTETLIKALEAEARSLKGNIPGGCFTKLVISDK